MTCTWWRTAQSFQCAAASRGSSKPNFPDRLRDPRLSPARDVWLGPSARDRRPVSLRPRAHRLRFASLRRGHPSSSVRKAGRPSPAVGPTDGVHFAVWAPNADRVSVDRRFQRVGRPRALDAAAGAVGRLGDFHSQSSRRRALQFEIGTKGGGLLKKSDPFGDRRSSRRRDRRRLCATCPATSGTITAGWQTRRSANAWLDRPMSIYEVHLGSWARVPEEGNRWLTYRELAAPSRALREGAGLHARRAAADDGASIHGVVGLPGAPVFRADDAGFGPPEDFKFFVDACHQAGLGVILDWVPGHFPERRALVSRSSTARRSSSTPTRGRVEHQDWGTLIFNYGRNEVSNFLLSSALCWLDRVPRRRAAGRRGRRRCCISTTRAATANGFPTNTADARTSRPIEFLQRLNTLTHGEQPGTITAAEESTAWPGVSRPVHLGGLGFHVQVEHGLDARRAAVRQQGSRSSAGGSTTC